MISVWKYQSDHSACTLQMPPSNIHTHTCEHTHTHAQVWPDWMRNKVTEREGGRERKATWEIMSGANAAWSMKLKPSHNAAHGIFPVHIPKQLTSATSCPLAVIWWAAYCLIASAWEKHTSVDWGGRSCRQWSFGKVQVLTLAAGMDSWHHSCSQISALDRLKHLLHTFSSIGVPNERNWSDTGLIQPFQICKIQHPQNEILRLLRDKLQFLQRCHEQH